jgi:hypothetical protein
VFSVRSSLILHTEDSSLTRPLVREGGSENSNCLPQNLEEIANLVAGPRWAPDAKTDWATHMSVVMWLWLWLLPPPYPCAFLPAFTCHRSHFLSLKAVHVGFTGDRMSLEQIFCANFSFPLLIIMPQMPHTHHQELVQLCPFETTVPRDSVSPHCYSKQKINSHSLFPSVCLSLHKPPSVLIIQTSWLAQGSRRAVCFPFFLHRWKITSQSWYFSTAV